MSIFGEKVYVPAIIEACHSSPCAGIGLVVKLTLVKKV